MNRTRSTGFSLVEVAVVMAIVGLVLGSAMLTLSAQVDTRNFNETQRRLEEARELLLAFASHNKRLPCPATLAAGNGDEAPVGGGTCTSFHGGFLPARAIGFQATDATGFAVDAWGNRIRYAVSSTPFGTPVANGNFTRAHTSGDSNQQWQVTNPPLAGDLRICNAAVGSATDCDAGSQLVNDGVVVALVFSTGKNGATGGTGANESRNLDANGMFVSRASDPAGAAGGEFDDQMLWIPVTLLYSRMIAAGILP